MHVQFSVQPTTKSPNPPNQTNPQPDELATKYCFSSVISNPAIVALVNVLIAPVSIALTATRDTSALRPGEICASTPIWLPREPIFAKPQRA